MYSGAAALTAQAGKHYVAAFVDLGMPLMDGFEVARNIRASDGRTPLVAVTGWGQEHDRAAATAAGFDHHLTKPADLTRLRDVLESIIGKPA